jgi:hypothetical protein
VVIAIANGTEDRECESRHVVRFFKEFMHCNAVAIMCICVKLKLQKLKKKYLKLEIRDKNLDGSHFEIDL